MGATEAGDGEGGGERGQKLMLELCVEMTGGHFAQRRSSDARSRAL